MARPCRRVQNPLHKNPWWTRHFHPCTKHPQRTRRHQPLHIQLCRALRRRKRPHERLYHPRQTPPRAGRCCHRVRGCNKGVDSGCKGWGEEESGFSGKAEERVLGFGPIYKGSIYLRSDGFDSWRGGSVFLRWFEIFDKRCGEWANSGGTRTWGAGLDFDFETFIFTWLLS